MKIVALLALALVLAHGVAFAQSPGTVGAMNDVSMGIATSANDVAMQQEGRSTAAEGAKAVAHPMPQAKGQSPGTVGATPGTLH